MAEALWELNSKGTLAHFHGVVLDERPMLVIAYEEVGSTLRSHASEAAGRLTAPSSACMTRHNGPVT